MYKDCHRFSEYSDQISVWLYCLTYTLCVKLRHKSELPSTEDLLYSTRTWSYGKAQKSFDGTKRINAKVE